MRHTPQSVLLFTILTLYRSWVAWVRLVTTLRSTYFFNRGWTTRRKYVHRNRVKSYYCHFTSLYRFPILKLIRIYFCIWFPQIFSCDYAVMNMRFPFFTHAKQRYPNFSGSRHHSAKSLSFNLRKIVKCKGAWVTCALSLIFIYSRKNKEREMHEKSISKMNLHVKKKTIEHDSPLASSSQISAISKSSS